MNCFKDHVYSLVGHVDPFHGYLEARLGYCNAPFMGLPLKSSLKLLYKTPQFDFHEALGIVYLPQSVTNKFPSSVQDLGHQLYTLNGFIPICPQDYFS